MGKHLDGKALSYYGAHFVVLISAITFLTGYWFLGKSNGEAECTTPIADQVKHYGGGVAGVTLGVILYLMAKWVLSDTSKTCVYLK